MNFVDGLYFNHYLIRNEEVEMKAIFFFIAIVFVNFSVIYAQSANTEFLQEGELNSYFHKFEFDTANSSLLLFLLNRDA